MRIRLLAIGLASTALLAVANVDGDGVAAAETTCPSSNGPNEMVVAAGTPQTTKVGTTFATNLAVQLASSEGCPVTTNQGGVSVTFTAPSSGASGTFSNTGTNTATVGTMSSGQAEAPAFTANDVEGSYTVVATSVYGSVSFSLTNTASGVAASVTTASGSPQSAAVGTTFAMPLAARVVDTNGAPVAGVSVSFTIVAKNDAGAAFATGDAAATATTNSSGVATSPPLTANTVAGSYAAAASLPGVFTPAMFELTNLASAPHTITPGVGASQSAPMTTAFPVPLAVTVTDVNGNAVPGAVVTFQAPTSGASGTFAGRGSTAFVTTDSTGIAVAPAYIANGVTGGYIVTASVAGISPPASFALANLAGPGLTLSAPIVGMAGTPDGSGYWLVAADGGVFAHGGAGFFGSTGALHLAQSIVGMASTPDGGGYWLVAADGGIFTFGNAPFLGSTGALHLAAPIVAMARTHDGAGYWLVAADGGIFTFGDAPFLGSGAGSLQGQRGIAVSPIHDDHGYWIAAAGGAVHAVGDAPPP